MSAPLRDGPKRTRKPAIKTRVNAAAAALEARGLRPCAMDILPTGTVRFHFSPPGNDNVEADLDEELAGFINGKV